MTLRKAFKESPAFAELYDMNPTVKEIIDVSMKIEGLPRNTGVHACGVLIAPGPVENYLPQVQVFDEELGVWEDTTQVTMSECEELGLLKMDFLGLRTMGVASKALDLINKKRLLNKETELTFETIPLDDTKVYEFISKGATEGVFQLESPGMTVFMKELFQDVTAKIKAKKFISNKKFGEELFERLIAGISLYRPGPLDEIPNYIKYMLDSDSITYDIDGLKNILSNTYSVIVYQEQVMFIVRELAGFTKGQADTIRKAMGKKVKAILDEYKVYFIYGSEDKGIKGCVNNGISEEAAMALWDKMEKFGRYAFNKSHAAGYSVISIRTGWLSFYYPIEYMTATLNSFINKADRIRLYMSISKKKGIKILPPDVNLSESIFTVEGEAIRFGLQGLKGVGKAADLILKERQERGVFADYQEFIERMIEHQKVNKKVLESLIYTGAMDSYPGTRKEKIIAIKDMLKTISSDVAISKSGQTSLFDYDEGFAELKVYELPTLGEFEELHILDKENEFAGFYISGHPLNVYEDVLDTEKVTEIGYILLEDEDMEDEESEYTFEKESQDGEFFKIAGIIRDMKPLYTKKNNDLMYIFQVEDRSGILKMVVFPKQVEAVGEHIFDGHIVMVEGQLTIDDYGTQLIVNSMTPLEDVKSRQAAARNVTVEISTKEQQELLLKVVKNNPGNVPVTIKAKGKEFKLKNALHLSIEVFNTLNMAFGADKVSINY